MPVRSGQLLQARDAALGCLHSIEGTVADLLKAWAAYQGKDDLEPFDNIAKNHFEVVSREKNALETALTSPVLIAIENANTGSNPAIINFMGKLVTTYHRAAMRAIEVFEAILSGRNNGPMPVWVYTLILKVSSEGSEIISRGLAAYYERVMGEIRQYPVGDLESLTAQVRREYVQAAMYTHNFVTPDEIALVGNSADRVRRPAPMSPAPPARPFAPLQANVVQQPASGPRSSYQPETLSATPPPTYSTSAAARRPYDKIEQQETPVEQLTPLQDRALACFPTPAHILWREVEITFISDLQIDVIAGDMHRKSDFIEMDMVEHETGQPNELWDLLRRFCEMGSIVAWTAQSKVSRPQPIRQGHSDTDNFWDNIEAAETGPASLRISIGDSQFNSSDSTRSQHVSELRKKLKSYFRIPGDPIELRSEKGEDNVIIKRYWKPAFKSLNLTSTTASQ